MKETRTKRPKVCIKNEIIFYEYLNIDTTTYRNICDQKLGIAGALLPIIEPTSSLQESP